MCGEPRSEHRKAPNLSPLSIETPRGQYNSVNIYEDEETKGDFIRQSKVSNSSHPPKENAEILDVEDEEEEADDPNEPKAQCTICF